MSYADRDDQHEGGKLADIGQRLREEVQLHTGEPFAIFQGRLDVAWGQNWQEQLQASLNEALFLIPVITPGFFKDPGCRAELERFLERERAAGRSDLILPIYYINYPPLNTPTRTFTDPLVQAVAAHQHIDWRGLRFDPLDDRKVSITIARMAEHISTALGHGQQQTRTTSRIRVFISYKRHVAPDEPLAMELYTALKLAGHEPFIDQTMTIGTEWAREIEQQIADSDFLLVLLSDASVHSEMVAKEIECAHRQSQHTDKARILPIRVAYTERLPYQLRPYLDRIHYAEWFHERDTSALLQQVLTALATRQPLPASPFVGATPTTHSAAIPRPAADPHFLQTLPEPGGALELDSTLYIERQSDAHLRRELRSPGRTLTTIRAPRQSGKSSLLIQGIAAAQQEGRRTAFIDLQFVDQSYLESLDRFLYYFGSAVLEELDLDPEAIEPFWERAQAPTMKFTALMERYILAQDDTRLVLAIDEADRLLRTEFRDTFYGAVRAWHNKGARDKRWKRVDIVLAISTEPHLLIHDVHQSPFNVGSRIHLDDFTPDQVAELSRRYQLDLDVHTHTALLHLLNGHPYLTSKALALLVTGRMTWEQLQRDACDERGPFGDHLRRYMWLLRDEPDLQHALKQIIQTGQCPDEVAFYRLSQAGVVQHSRSAGCRCRCQLYTDYFRERLL
jgi:hypothetical protein